MERGHDREERKEGMTVPADRRDMTDMICDMSNIFHILIDSVMEYLKGTPAP